MDLDVVVTQVEPASTTASERQHNVWVDLSKVSSESDLFEALAKEMELPDYFGYNWAALDECFSDYFVIESGGLGSEFGDRQGIEAELVRIVLTKSGNLVAHGRSLLARFVDLLHYVQEVNHGRRSAGLEIVFQVSSHLQEEVFRQELARGPNV